MTEKIVAATKDTFRSLHNRNYRLYWTSLGISMIGTWVQLIAQALLVLDLTNSGVALGAITATQFAPVLLLGPWAGVIADRVDKRKLLYVTQTALALLATTLGVLVLTGSDSLVAVFVLAALTGVVTAIDNPARRVIINELVDDADVANAISLSGALMNGAKIIGPAVAGLLIGTVGIGWCFLLNGVSYIAVLVGLARIDPAGIRKTELMVKGKGQIRAGLRYVWTNVELRIALGLLAVVATLAFNWQVLLPLLATRDLGGDAGTYTVIASIMSIGSLSGSLWVARRRMADSRFLAVSCALLGLMSLGVAVAPTLPLVCVAGIAAGASAMVFLNSSLAALQLGATPLMRGRVMALFSMVLLGSTPIGGPLMGWIGEHFGARVGLGLGAVATMTAGFGVLFVLRRRPLVLGEASATPAPVLEAA